MLNELYACHPVAEISIMSSYVSLLASDWTLQQWRGAMHANREKIAARDSSFFITHEPFREWLNQYVNRARIDALIESMWTNNTDEFREAMWMWLAMLAA